MKKYFVFKKMRLQLELETIYKSEDNLAEFCYPKLHTDTRNLKPLFIAKLMSWGSRIASLAIRVLVLLQIPSEPFNHFPMITTLRLDPNDVV